MNDYKFIFMEIILEQYFCIKIYNHHYKKENEDI
jgi:hypothetical protein